MTICVIICSICFIIAATSSFSSVYALTSDLREKESGITTTIDPIVFSMMDLMDLLKLLLLNTSF